MIRYCVTEGGSYLAYVVEGDGPPLLLISDGFVPVEAMREEPSFRGCLDRLGRGRQLIRFDRRGVGLADPLVDGYSRALDAWTRDAVAVLDAAGAASADVLASVENSAVALRLAASQPERVTRLALFAPSARGLAAEDYPIGFPEEVLSALVESTTDLGATGIGSGVLALNAPSKAHDPAFRQWWERAGRQGASPSVARELLRAVLHADVRHALPHVRCPVLVLHRRGDQLMPESHSRYVADNVPHGRFVSLPGADNLWWVGETAALLDELDAFLSVDASGHVPVQASRRSDERHGGAAEAGLGPMVLAALEERRRALAMLSALTTRELEILRLMADGSSNSAICRQLFLSPKTVETHIGRIFTKLGLQPGDDVHRRVLAVRRVLGSS